LIIWHDDNLRRSLIPESEENSHNQLPSKTTNVKMKVGLSD
jgi:hypothetical protein